MYRLIVLVLFSSVAHAGPWQPGPGHTQVPLWPGPAPDLQRGRGPEDELVTEDNLVAGKPWRSIRNVVVPTLTVYPPTGRSTGTAVLVFPGGGYQILAIDLEGTEVCDWLTAKGVTCVLLKYRVPGTGLYPKPAPYGKSGPYPRSAAALQDAQRALGLMRLHAAEWHIDPHKIGVLGFSAGGHLVAATSTHDQRVYEPIDAADRESCRPDFAVSLYPGHLWDERQRLVPDIKPTAHTPPTFLLQAEDDPVDDVRHALVYHAALVRAKVPAELHIYPHGGHAFGLRRTREPITAWPALVETWLAGLGMLPDGPTAAR